jgi:uncharacterized protein
MTVRKVTTVETLEALVGTRPQAMLMKAVDALDDGCQIVLANAPIAGFGYRDADGTPQSTLVGGAPGFVHVDSPTRISFDLHADEAAPVKGGGVSLVFLLPGVGETLRFTGYLAERLDSRVLLDLEEAWVHCAKCILRSRLWEDSGTDGAAARETQLDRAGEIPGPLDDGEIASFLASSPFLLLSSWDASGSSDTSPRGDHAGFVQLLDSHTLAIPDRKGNRRTDTFHNLLECDEIALAAVVPGRDEIAKLSGTAHVTDDPGLLSTMAVRPGEKPPKAALIVRTERASIVPNDAIGKSRMWERSSHVDPAAVPDLMQLGAQHLAKSKARGAKASMTRAVSRGLAASPKSLRRGVDRGYRKELEEEGF